MSRTIPSSKVFRLAHELVSHESPATTHSATGSPAVFRVVEKLGRPISTLAGTAGLRSLLFRALMLAKPQVPGLNAVRVTPDGSLEGCDGIGNQDQAAEAGIMILAQLLGLLSLFIGEGVMVSVVRDVWPDFPVVPGSSDDQGNLEEMKS